MSNFPENSQYKVSTDFSKRLKHLIYESESQSNKEFARLMGVSPIIISNAVNYGIVPSVRTLIKIADKLELSLKYVLGIDNKNDFIQSENQSSFHTRLAELINEYNINYNILATKNSFHRAYVYEWMREGTLPSLDYLLEIADYFKVSPDYLLGRTDYRN